MTDTRSASSSPERTRIPVESTRSVNITVKSNGLEGLLDASGVLGWRIVRYDMPPCGDKVGESSDVEAGELPGKLEAASAHGIGFVDCFQCSIDEVLQGADFLELVVEGFLALSRPHPVVNPANAWHCDSLN
jgi:hypothetical protein